MLPPRSTSVGNSVPVAGVTFDHIFLDGYNEAVSMINTNNIQVKDSTLRAK